MLEPGYSGVELTGSIRDQLDKIAIQIKEGLSESLEAMNLTGVLADEKVLVPLIRLPPFSTTDLLDSSSERRRDIQIVVRQVGRHILQRGRGRIPKEAPFIGGC